MQIRDLEPELSPPKQESSNFVRPQEPETDLPFYRQLGRSDLTVSCLGLGGGGSISSEDTLYAFDRGINYFFYSSDLHHYQYSRMSGALRQLCGRKSSVREQVVLATVTYIKNPEMVMAALHDQIIDLGIDYIDVFFWGWIGKNDGPALNDCLQLSPDLRGPNSVYQRSIEKIFDTSERMKKMGIVRYIGASFHDLDLAQSWLGSPLLDVVMVRNNPAHRSATNKIFDRLDKQDKSRPGIVTFKSTGNHDRLPLWNAPDGLPKNCWKPSVPDLYRYSLSQNCVDVCLTGLTSSSQVDAAISGVQQGKLTAAELDYLKVYGDLHRGDIKIEEVAPERLLYK